MTSRHPVWKETPLGLQVKWGDVEFRFSMVRVRSDALSAYVEVRRDNELLSLGTYNLLGARTASTLGKLCADRSPGLDWVKLVLEMTHEAANRMLSPPPELDFEIGDGDASRWMLRPLLEEGSPTRLVAAGGSAKSMLSLAIGAAVGSGSGQWMGIKPSATGSVLYLDWESDRLTHASRLRALMRGHGIRDKPDMGYIKMTMPLYHQAHRLARLAENKALVIIDSAMLARGSSDGPAEESALRLFSSLAEMGVASLIVDHKPKAAIQAGKLGGYGSVTMTNTARLEWEVVRLVQEGDGTSLVWRNTKANSHRLSHDLGWSIQWMNDDGGELVEALITSLDVSELSDLGIRATEGASLADQIEQTLRRNGWPMTHEEIAHEVHTSPNQVRARMREVEKRTPLVRIKVPGSRSIRWSLAETPGQEPFDDGSW